MANAAPEQGYLKLWYMLCSSTTFTFSSYLDKPWSHVFAFTLPTARRFSCNFSY